MPEANKHPGFSTKALLLFFIVAVGFVVSWALLMFGNFGSIEIENQEFSVVSILISFSMLIVLIGIWFWYFFHRRNRQREEDIQNNLIQDAGGEPHIIRELTAYERSFLKAKQRIGTGDAVLIAAFIIASLVYLVYITSGMDNRLYAFIPFGIAFFVGLVVFSWHRRKYYLDLRSNTVWQIQGELIKQTSFIIRLPNQKAGEVFIVRGMIFTNYHIENISWIWEDYKTNDTVRIEYSPYSKHVWKMEKVSN